MAIARAGLKDFSLGNAGNDVKRNSMAKGLGSLMTGKVCARRRKVLPGIQCLSSGIRHCGITQ